MYPIWVIVACVVTLQGVFCAEWSYSGPEGTDEWENNFPPCGESRQSPVNIVDEEVIAFQNVPAFIYKNYDTTSGVNMTLKNNGHSAAIALGGVTPITVEGGGLPHGEFKAVQLHFHWGDANDVGSEHLINNEAFPMELHVVHVNTKYTDFNLALRRRDGLAVLGFIFKVSLEENTNYTGILNYLPSIQHPGSSVPMPALPLKSLLPVDTSKFYRYYGSLTTPSCFESVTWTIFKEPIQISESQLKQFRALLDTHAEPLVNNFRPVQALNRRRVTANFDPAAETEQE